MLTNIHWLSKFKKGILNAELPRLIEQVLLSLGSIGVVNTFALVYTLP